MTTYTPSSNYILKSFTIQKFLPEPKSLAPSIDLKNLIHTFEIVESIFSGAVRGTAKVYDALGIFYDLPISGQELVNIVYTDFEGIERSEDFFLYAVTDIRPSKEEDESLLEYVIHFVSLGKYYSDRYLVRRTLARGTGQTREYLSISEQAQILFDDYYSPDLIRKSIDITETSGPQKLVIPALKPEDAMHFLSRRAYESTTSMNMFRFFESRNQYHFKNIEEMFGEPKKSFTYVSEPIDNTPENEIRKRRRILSYTLPSFDTLEDFQKGAWRRRLIEIDLLNRRTPNQFYDHTERFRDFTYPNRTDITFRLTEEFVQDQVNMYHETYVFKDYPDIDLPNSRGLRPQTFYADIYNNKGANLAHFNNTRLSLSVYGSNDLFAGDIIDISLPQIRTKTDSQSRNESISGAYFIESIINTFFENQYVQKMTLVRGGIRNV